MDMQKVVEFLLRIPKQERPENLETILEALLQKPDTDGNFICGTNGKVYMHCFNRFVEIRRQIPGDADIYGEIDTDKLFNLFVEYLDGLNEINFNAEWFNLWCQQLIELDAEKAMPIIENHLLKIGKMEFRVYFVCHCISGLSVYNIFLARNEERYSSKYAQLYRVKIVSTIPPNVSKNSHNQYYAHTISPLRLECAEFLLNTLVGK